MWLGVVQRVFLKQTSLNSELFRSVAAAHLLGRLGKTSHIGLRSAASGLDCIRMEGLAKIDAVYIALVFVIPGYVFLSLRNTFVAGQGKLNKEQILSYLTVSGVNFALFGWIIYFAYSYNFNTPVKVASWIFVLVLIPAAGGILSGTWNQRDLVRRIYQRFGLTPIHAVPNAWDYKFSRSPGEWVLVTLKSGTQYAGFWASASFASDDPKERDLLIERIYEIDEPWRPTEKSLLITAGEISTIEFIPQQERKQ
jgi:hypothetical protein